MFLLTIALILILLYEVPTLVKKKMWRELAVFSVLFLIGSFYSFGQVMRADLPNPTVLIEIIYGPMAEAIETMLSK